MRGLGKATSEEAIIELLRRVPLFGSVSTALLRKLALHGRRRKFGPNEALFHEGDPGQTLYVIISGRVHIERVGRSGDTVHLATRSAGECVGEMALLDGKPRMADAVTAETSELLMLDRGDFVRCIESSPALALAIMASLADRLREAAEDLENSRQLDVLGRVSRFLADQIEAHGRKEANGIRLDARWTHQDMAAKVGAKRESVSRAISALRAAGVLRMEGRTIIITKPTELQQFCDR